MLLELLWGRILVDSAHKNVLVDDPLWVCSKKVVIEGEPTGSLTTLHLKVPHLLASLSKLVVFRYCHDRRVERSVKVSANLWMA